MSGPSEDPTPVLRLCYVSDAWAWFTTLPLVEQWGDDWNDEPYQHNAGTPYEWNPQRNPPERKYEIRKVAWSGPFETPADRGLDVSVEQINSGLMAWLQHDGPPLSIIVAGETLDEFRRKIEAAGGTVYLPAAPAEAAPS